MKTRTFPAIRLISALAAMLLILAACGGDDADASSDYDGDRLTFLIPNAPGGGNDTIVRAMAPYLADELGADVVPENMTGAGGLIAFNYLYSQRGSNEVISLANGIGMMIAVLVEAEGIEFDIDEMNPLVRISHGPRVLMTALDGRYQTMEEVMAASDVRAGSSGPGSSGHIDYILYYDVLGVEGEIITGFDGNAEIDLAMHAGDVDLQAGAGGSNAPKCTSGEATCLLTLGRTGLPGLEDVPLIGDIEMSDEAREIFDVHLDTMELGRIILAPPDVDEDQVAAIEQALLRVLEDEEFLAELDTLLDEDVLPLGSDDLRDLMNQVLNAPQEYVSVLEAAYAE